MGLIETWELFCSYRVSTWPTHRRLKYLMLEKDNDDNNCINSLVHILVLNSTFSWPPGFITPW